MTESCSPRPNPRKPRPFIEPFQRTVRGPSDGPKRVWLEEAGAVKALSNMAPGETVH